MKELMGNFSASSIAWTQPSANQLFSLDQTPHINVNYMEFSDSNTIEASKSPKSIFPVKLSQNTPFKSPLSKYHYFSQSSTTKTSFTTKDNRDNKMMIETDPNSPFSILTVPIFTSSSFDPGTPQTPFVSHVNNYSYAPTPSIDLDDQQVQIDQSQQISPYHSPSTKILSKSSPNTSKSISRLTRNHHSASRLTHGTDSPKSTNSIVSSKKRPRNLFFDDQEDFEFDQSPTKKVKVAFDEPEIEQDFPEETFSTLQQPLALDDSDTEMKLDDDKLNDKVAKSDKNIELDVSDESQLIEVDSDSDAPSASSTPSTRSKSRSSSTKRRQPQRSSSNRAKKSSSKTAKNTSSVSELTSKSEFNSDDFLAAMKSKKEKIPQLSTKSTQLSIQNEALQNQSKSTNQNSNQFATQNQSKSTNSNQFGTQNQSKSTNSSKNAVINSSNHVLIDSESKKSLLSKLLSCPIPPPSVRDISRQISGTNLNHLSDHHTASLLRTKSGNIKSIYQTTTTTATTTKRSLNNTQSINSSQSDAIANDSSQTHTGYSLDILSPSQITRRSSNTRHHPHVSDGAEIALSWQQSSHYSMVNASTLNNYDFNTDTADYDDYISNDMEISQNNNQTNNMNHLDDNDDDQAFYQDYSTEKSFQFSKSTQDSSKGKNNSNNSLNMKNNVVNNNNNNNNIVSNNNNNNNASLLSRSLFSSHGVTQSLYLAESMENFKKSQKNQSHCIEDEEDAIIDGSQDVFDVEATFPNHHDDDDDDNIEIHHFDDSETVPRFVHLSFQSTQTNTKTNKSKAPFQSMQSFQSTQNTSNFREKMATFIHQNNSTKPSINNQFSMPTQTSSHRSHLNSSLNSSSTQMMFQQQHSQTQRERFVLPKQTSSVFADRKTTSKSKKPKKSALGRLNDAFIDATQSKTISKEIEEIIDSEGENSSNIDDYITNNSYFNDRIDSSQFGQANRGSKVDLIEEISSDFVASSVDSIASRTPKPTQESYSPYALLIQRPKPSTQSMIEPTIAIDQSEMDIEEVEFNARHSTSPSFSLHTMNNMNSFNNLNTLSSSRAMIQANMTPEKTLNFRDFSSSQNMLALLSRELSATFPSELNIIENSSDDKIIVKVLLVGPSRNDGIVSVLGINMTEASSEMDIFDLIASQDKPKTINSSYVICFVKEREFAPVKNSILWLERFIQFSFIASELQSTQTNTKSTNQLIQPQIIWNYHLQADEKLITASKAFTSDFWHLLDDSILPQLANVSQIPDFSNAIPIQSNTTKTTNRTKTISLFDNLSTPTKEKHFMRDIAKNLIVPSQIPNSPVSSLSEMFPASVLLTPISKSNEQHLSPQNNNSFQSGFVLSTTNTKQAKTTVFYLPTGFNGSITSHLQLKVLDIFESNNNNRKSNNNNEIDNINNRKSKKNLFVDFGSNLKTSHFIGKTSQLIASIEHSCMQKRNLFFETSSKEAFKLNNIIKSKNKTNFPKSDQMKPQNCLILCQSLQLNCLLWLQVDSSHSNLNQGDLIEIDSFVHFRHSSTKSSSIGSILSNFSSNINSFASSFSSTILSHDQVKNQLAKLQFPDSQESQIDQLESQQNNTSNSSITFHSMIPVLKYIPSISNIQISRTSLHLEQQTQKAFVVMDSFFLSSICSFPRRTSLFGVVCGYYPSNNPQLYVVSFLTLGKDASNQNLKLLINKQYLKHFEPRCCFIAHNILQCSPTDFYFDKLSKYRSFDNDNDLAKLNSHSAICLEGFERFSKTSINFEEKQTINLLSDPQQPPKTYNFNILELLNQIDQMKSIQYIAHPKVIRFTENASCCANRIIETFECHLGHSPVSLIPDNLVEYFGPIEESISSSLLKGHCSKCAQNGLNVVPVSRRLNRSFNLEIESDANNLNHHHNQNQNHHHNQNPSETYLVSVSMPELLKLADSSIVAQQKFAGLVLPPIRLVQKDSFQNWALLN